MNDDLFIDPTWHSAQSGNWWTRHAGIRLLVYQDKTRPGMWKIMLEQEGRKPVWPKHRFDNYLSAQEAAVGRLNALLQATFGLQEQTNEEIMRTRLDRFNPPGTPS